MIKIIGYFYHLVYVITLSDHIKQLLSGLSINAHQQERQRETIFDRDRLRPTNRDMITKLYYNCFWFKNNFFSAQLTDKPVSMETVQSPTRVTAKSDGNIFNDVTNIYHLISLMYFSFSFILSLYSWRELGRLEQWFSIFFTSRHT